MQRFLDLKGNDHWHLKTNPVSKLWLWQSSVAVLAAQITACPCLFWQWGIQTQKENAKYLLLDNYTESGTQRAEQRDCLVPPLLFSESILI